MRVHQALIALGVWAAANWASADQGTGGAAGRKDAAPRDETLYADLCRGSDSCRQVVLVRRDGVTLLRVFFLHANRFIDEDQDYCDAREYWYVKGGDRTLLARDCAEQSGPDSQGPVQATFDGKRLKFEYLEWQANDGCERAVVAVDWTTGKVVSSKRWTGQSRAQRTVCAQQKVIKADSHLGVGSSSDPLIAFHR